VENPQAALEMKVPNLQPIKELQLVLMGYQ
jgi:hypothetical protein